MEKVHRAFHATLIGLCGSRPLLISFCEQLADRLYRYRMMSIAKAYPARKVGAEHSDILQAVLARDTEQAVRLLQAALSAHGRRDLFRSRWIAWVASALPRGGCSPRRQSQPLPNELQEDLDLGER